MPKNSNHNVINIKIVNEKKSKKRKSKRKKQALPHHAVTPHMPYSITPYPPQPMLTNKPYFIDTNSLLQLKDADKPTPGSLHGFNPPAPPPRFEHEEQSRDHTFFENFPPPMRFSNSDTEDDAQSNVSDILSLSKIYPEQQFQEHTNIHTPLFKDQSELVVHKNLFQTLGQQALQSDNHVHGITKQVHQVKHENNVSRWQRLGKSKLQQFNTIKSRESFEEEQKKLVKQRAYRTANGLNDMPDHLPMTDKEKKDRDNARQATQRASSIPVRTKKTNGV
jgi:hypothetical protein